MGKKTPTQRIRANELRRIEKSKRRQAYFISDYVQAKYFNIYSEAANFYNALNTLYPSKYDLRKTAEFRGWKMSFNRGESKTKRQSVQLYQNIYTDTDLENDQRSETEPQSPGDQRSETEPQSPGDQRSETEPQSPGDQRSETEPHSPGDQRSETEPQCPGDQRSETGSQSPGEQRTWNDNMELRIPLINYKPSTPRPTVTTQTIEITTEETLSQSENNILNELTNARIDEIIQELRQDPELQHIFNEVQLDEGIDIDLYDIRLENELLSW